MKDRLILIIGASGSGKTTIAKELEKEGHNVIQSYTTRKPREKGEWGHTFIKGGWVNNDDLNEIFVGEGRDGKATLIVPKENIMAYQKLYGEHYLATDSQYRGKGTSIYVVDPDGAKQVEENVDDAEVITIFLMADKLHRYWRMYGHREMEVLDERIAKDREVFKTCKCDYVIDANRSIDEVLKDVVEILD